MYTGNTRVEGGGDTRMQHVLPLLRGRMLRGVDYCSKKSVARAGVVSQCSHNTGSIWLKVVSTASSMNYVG